MRVVVALGVAAVAALGGWHAWMESKSFGWALGYAGVALLSLGAALKRRPPREERVEGT